MENTGLILLISILFSPPLFAQAYEEKRPQNAPVIFEALIGSGGFASQMVINKGFSGMPRLFFFSVTNISSKWNESVSNDAMNQANLAFELVRSIRIIGGMHYTPVTGLRPSVALIYNRVTKSFVASIGPRLDLANNSNIEGFGMFEYTPILNEKWSVYSRLQGIYSADLKMGMHARSYLMARVGATYLNFNIGAGANWDAFGPEKLCNQNYGVFLAAKLFN